MSTSESRHVIFSNIGRISSSTTHFSRPSSILPMHTNDATLVLTALDSQHSFLILGINWCLTVCVSNKLVNDGSVSKHSSWISVVSASRARQTKGKMCSRMSVGGVLDKIIAMFLSVMSKICIGFCSLKTVFKPGRMYLTNSSLVDWSEIRNMFGSRNGIISGFMNSCSRQGIIRWRQTLLKHQKYKLWWV